MVLSDNFNIDVSTGIDSHVSDSDLKKFKDHNKFGYIYTTN